MLKRSLVQIAADIASKKVTATEVVKACLDQIEKTKSLNTLNSVYAENALLKAAEIDKKIASDEKLGRLAGVPIVVKDNINVKGMLNTCSSKMLSNYEAIFNATVVEKLLNEDVIILGKTNMDEFAMGSSNETSYFGAVLNPHDNTRVSGGSSGGSAAAVAAYQAYAALGSDTGGSIRVPCAYCGVVGVKPTYGTVSRYGAVAMASSLDQIGAITRTVEDNALIMDIISGHDEKEETSKTEKIDYLTHGKKDLKNLRIGVVKEFTDSLKDEEVKHAYLDQIDKAKKFGAKIVELNINAIKYASSAYYVVSAAEASSNLARFDGVRYGYRAKDYKDSVDMFFKTRTQGFGAEVKRRILVGNFVLSKENFEKYYTKALKVQTLIKQEYKTLFSNCDLLITPVTASPAFRISEKQSDPVAMLMSDAFTVGVNMAGNAAINYPVGKTKDGLPLGVQLIVDDGNENLMYNVAKILSQ